MAEPTTHDPTSSFHAASSRGKPLSVADFEGKVPLAIVLLGPLDPESPALVELDQRHVDFGRRRVQLLVVAHAGGPEVRAVPWSGLELPVLADPHGEIASRFGGEGSFVLLDATGAMVDQGRYAGADDLLARVDAAFDIAGLPLT